MKKGIISLGEALIDFIPVDQSNATYFKSPGGAPANVAVGVARLGAKSTFIGKVGNDVIGNFMKSTLDDYGVRTTQMKFSTNHRTGLVFVTNAEDGERDFQFYINPSADQFLESAELEEIEFTTHKVLHIGSISLIRNPAKKATHHAVKLAKESGMLISYDPNLRLSLWDSEESARDTVSTMFQYTDFLKLSEEELIFLTHEKTIENGIQKLRRYDIPLIIVTLGAEGCEIHMKEESAHVPAMKVQAIDTTGAGDAFVSGMLYSLDEYDDEIHSLTLQDAVEMARFASVSGALAASTKGAMTALPSLKEVRKHLNK